MLIRAGSKGLSKCFSTYPKAMYDIWKKDPSKVHSTWNDYFKSNDLSFSAKSTSETSDTTADK